MKTKPKLKFAVGESPAVVMRLARQALEQEGRIIDLRDFLIEATERDYSHFIFVCGQWFDLENYYGMSG